MPTYASQQPSLSQNRAAHQKSLSKTAHYRLDYTNDTSPYPPIQTASGTITNENRQDSKTDRAATRGQRQLDEPRRCRTADPFVSLVSRPQNPQIVIRSNWIDHSIVQAQRNPKTDSSPFPLPLDWSIAQPIPLDHHRLRN